MRRRGAATAPNRISSAGKRYTAVDRDRLAVGLRLAKLRVAVAHLLDGGRDLAGTKLETTTAPSVPVGTAHGHRHAREPPAPNATDACTSRPEGRLGECLAGHGVPGRPAAAAVPSPPPLARAGVDVHEIELAFARPHLDRAPQPPLLGGREQAARLDLAGQRPRVDPLVSSAALSSEAPRVCAEASMRSTSTLNQRSTVWRMQVAAHEQDQHRRRDHHQQEHEQQLHAQTGAEDAAAPLPSACAPGCRPGPRAGTRSRG